MIRRLVDEVLRAMSLEFDGLYAAVGRPSVPPEPLLRAPPTDLLFHWVREIMGLLYALHNRRLLAMLDSFRRNHCYEDDTVVLGFALGLD